MAVMFALVLLAVTVSGACAMVAAAITPREVESAFPSTPSLIREQNFGPRFAQDGIRLQWTFVERRSGFPTGGTLTMYTDAEYAIQAAAVAKSGKVVNDRVCLNCEPYRVANVLLVITSSFPMTPGEARALRTDLAKLGRIVSP